MLFAIEGSACRYSGSRLALLMPSAGERVEAALTVRQDALASLAGGPSCAAVSSLSGEERHAVLARAREELRADARLSRPA